MSDPDKFTEKRREARYALHLTGSASALYRRDHAASYGDLKLPAGAPFKVETINISAGGCMVTFDMELSAGDVLRIYLAHPETKAEIVLESQIQWLRRNATPLMGRYVAGLSFKNPDGEAVSSLLDYAMSRTQPFA